MSTKCDYAALALTILQRLHTMLAGCHAGMLFSSCYPTFEMIAQPQAEELPAALSLRPRGGECLFLNIGSMLLGVGVVPEVEAPLAEEASGTCRRWDGNLLALCVDKVCLAAIGWIYER